MLSIIYMKLMCYVRFPLPGFASAPQINISHIDVTRMALNSFASRCTPTPKNQEKLRDD